MKCPFCGYEDTRVLDSRELSDGRAIRRRRECPECHARFTTYERYETGPITVVKKMVEERDSIEGRSSMAS